MSSVEKNKSKHMIKMQVEANQVKRGKTTQHRTLQSKVIAKTTSSVPVLVTVYYLPKLLPQTITSEDSTIQGLSPDFSASDFIFKENCRYIIYNPNFLRENIID